MLSKEATANETVWIDDETERLIRIIESSPPSPDNEKVLDDLQAALLNTLIGPFGLSADLLEDVDGGNVTTLHNFEQGVTANAEDALRRQNYEKAQTERFDRTDYDAERKKKGARKERFQNPEPVVDAYTGKELPRNGQAQQDHVVSASEIERSAKGHFAQTREERVEIANQDANIVWTDSGMNQSKGDLTLEEWANKPSRKEKSLQNAEAFDVDRQAMNAVDKTAREAVNSAQRLAALKKNAQDLAVQGGLEAGKVALRQIVGLALRSLLKGIVADIRQLTKDGLRDVDKIMSILSARARAIVEEMKTRWAEFLKEGLAAAVSGLLSNLATFLINSFVTTVRNVVTIIREVIVSLVRAVKVVVAPEPGMTRSDIARDVLAIVGGAATTVIGIGAEEAIAKMLLSLPPLAPFAETLATVLSGALVSVGTIILLLAFDHLKASLAFRNKQFADVHRGNQVTLLKMRRTCFMIETSAQLITATHTEMHKRIETHSAERDVRRGTLDKSMNEYDAEVSGLQQLLNSFNQ
ncbi:hypothetical protein [Janthinobacterium sp. BJB446]|uniref:hypothetical protein n=1 Tax=Janthinobacterium sp. BJB446 TaxID=2048009 RepID=UPI00117B9418|nr:hypothetical protein [Janthinobacterium sp. BJB446]